MCASVAARHCSSPYLRYHWSHSATTHSSPLRLTTRDAGSQYSTAARACSSASRTSGFASFTSTPLCGPTSIVPR